MPQVVKKQYVSRSGEWVEVATGGGSVEVQTPVGVITAYGGSTAPTGWHLCDGSAHGSAALEVILGSADTPDLRGKFVIAADSTYPATTTGGAATHKLTVNEMPSHDHNVELGSGRGAVPVDGGLEGGGANRFLVAEGASYLYAAPKGGGAAHNNMPPYYSLTYIIKTT